MVMDEWKEENERASQAEKINGGTLSIRCHGNSFGSITQ